MHEHHVSVWGKKGKLERVERAGTWLERHLERRGTLLERSWNVPERGAMLN